MRDRQAQNCFENRVKNAYVGKYERASLTKPRKGEYVPITKIPDSVDCVM